MVSSMFVDLALFLGRLWFFDPINKNFPREDLKSQNKRDLTFSCLAQIPLKSCQKLAVTPTTVSIC